VAQIVALGAWVGTEASWGVYGFYPACVGASLGQYGGRYCSSSLCY
jgi:hypothetical protein